MLRQPVGRWGSASAGEPVGWPHSQPAPLLLCGYDNAPGDQAAAVLRREPRRLWPQAKGE